MKINAAGIQSLGGAGTFDCLDHSLKYITQKVTIHQITTMLATSKYVLFSGHNHLLTTGTDDPIL